MEFDFDKFDDSKKKTDSKPVEELEPPKKYTKDNTEPSEAGTGKESDKENGKKSPLKKKSDKPKKAKSKDGKGKSPAKGKDDSVTLSFTFKKLSKKQIIAIIVAAVLIIVCVPTGIYCGVHGESPADMMHDIFTKDETQIIGKWQSDNSKTGYQFNEDGTVYAYNGVLGDKNPFTYNYTLKGRKIIFSNSENSNTTEFDYSLHGTTLEMTVTKVNGNEETDRDKFVFAKVDNFNISSLMDTLAEAANEDKPATLTNNGENVVLGESDVYLKQYAQAKADGDTSQIEVLENDERIIYVKEGLEVTVKDAGDDYSSVKVEKGKYKGNLYYVSNDNIQYQ